MTKYLPFVFDNNGFLTNQKCFIITGKYTPFLTAFLNSSLFKYCFRDSFPELQGGTRELSKIFFDKIPVIEINEEINDEFKHLLLVVQQSTKDNTSIKSLTLEIDNNIFQLYGLSDEEKSEIGFIEIQ